ncbi:MAG: hypothetical protein EOO75_03150 [Myxococcales bacterium]|nr:MAG: hypothetical protein EOO75_03150 [Myxococcales bacterium]
MNGIASSRAIRATLVTLGLSGAVGCVGEAAVAAQGRVVASPSAGYTLGAASASADGLVPVPGASVALCVCASPCACDQTPRASASTDASGHFQTRSVMFPGMIGVDNHVVVRVTSPGFEPFTYTAKYGRSADEYPGPDGGKVQLDVRLRPAASSRAGGPSN